MYDIIFVSGEIFFDSPLSGVAILKRVLEKQGYKVLVVTEPLEADIKKLQKPKLFFAVSSGSIDSMVRNYTPLKKLRIDDKKLNYNETVPDRATIVYSNWIRRYFPLSPIVIGGTEATLRRFVHYDYWENRLRKPILFDSRADILAYGMAEKQILEIAKRIKNKASLVGIEGTCVISKEVPDGFVEIPSYDQVAGSKERFCDMQNLFSISKNLAQKIDNRYCLQFKSPEYAPKDLDNIYEMPFKRDSKINHLHGFEFSLITHRGCVGDCNFCSLTLTCGNKIVSRSEESIIRELEYISKLPNFRGIIDDFGGPSANMYGMDCHLCENQCIRCNKLDRSNKRLISLLKRASKVKGIKKIMVRSGVRFDLASDEYLDELKKHTSGKLKIAPEHVSKEVLELMNKDYGNLKLFVKKCKERGIELAYYLMVAHPGCGMVESRELRDAKLDTESVQVFTPTPMTVSTCMYHTGLDPKTKKKIYIPYAYKEKKEQKRMFFGK